MPGPMVRSANDGRVLTTEWEAEGALTVCSGWRGGQGRQAELAMLKEGTWICSRARNV